jgi:hypothetical protein
MFDTPKRVALVVAIGLIGASLMAAAHEKKGERQERRGTRNERKGERKERHGERLEAKGK